jgi:hypothetical protein
MVVDNSTGTKVKEHKEEEQRIKDYLNNRVANSWARLTRNNRHVNTFSNLARILIEQSVGHKLKTALAGMKAYVDTHMDALAHTGWPFELEDPHDVVLQHEDQGLARNTA